MGHKSHVPDLGVANGIATLDGAVQVPLAQLAGTAGKKDMLNAARDPIQTDDDIAGYDIGSSWLNTTTRRVWVCFDATTATAIWRRQDNTDQSESLGREAPGEHFYGSSLLSYGATGGNGNGEIQYTRVWLISGTVINSMQTYIASGGTGSRSVRYGLYSQTDPLDVNGDPVTRIAQTASSTTTGGSGTFFNLALISPYTVGATGYYWIASIQDSSAISFVTSASILAGFLPVRREDVGTGTTLPATAGTLNNPTSAVIYVSAVE
jgi:hypothetical protein